MRINLFLLIAILLTSCLGKSTVTPEQKANKLISDYLDSNLVSPESYMPIGFRKIDTVMTTFYDNPEYDHLPVEGRIQALRDSTTDYKDYRRKSDSGYYLRLDQVRSSVIDSLAKAHVPKIKFYRVVHTFRADGFNQNDLHVAVFKIDPGLTRIIGDQNMGLAFMRKRQKRFAPYKKTSPEKIPSPFKLIALGTK